MDPFVIYVHLWTVLTALVTLSNAESRCKFPREWKGKWYQGGLGEINIREKSISQKGICWEHHRDYYLVKNREQDCFICLLLMDRHRNVLQYKESYCIPNDSLRQVCRQIRVEAILFTLVREPHFTVKCPFADAYYFKYNDLMHGFCSDSISYAKPCAGESKYRFHFQHCNDGAMMHGRDLDFECVATWKDGSDMYMYGKFMGVSIESMDDSFRCFKYEYYGSELFMSMSADATCRGLRSTRDGPLIMQFTRDRGWPQSACRFPDWFNGQVWRDMSGRHIFQVLDRDPRTVEIKFRKRRDSRETTKAELRCMDVLQRNDTARTFMAVSYSSVGCTTKYQCVVIKQKVNDLIEVSLGKLVEEEEAKMCATRGEFPEDYLLIRSPTEGIVCPFQGRYHVLSGTANCHEDILTGCNATSQMDVRCEEDAGGLLQTQCLSSWKQDNTTLVLVRRLDATTRQDRISCISLTERRNTIEFSTDARCHKGISDLVEKPVELSLSRTKSRCEEAEVVHDGTGSSYAKVGINSKKEGSYQHVGRKNRDKKPQQSREVSYSTAPSAAARRAPSSTSALLCLLTLLGLSCLTR